MNYAVEVRSSKQIDVDEATDILMLDVIENFSCPENLEPIFGEDREAEMFSIFNVIPHTVGFETVEEEGETYDIEITNKGQAIETADVEEAEWLEVQCHCCSHDEAINRPCSPKRVEIVKGEVPEMEVE